MSTFFNSGAFSYQCSHKIDPSVLLFHQQLPDYAKTPLHSLPKLAKELGIGHILVKDESNRFGLPSFKVLGASWGVYRAVCQATFTDHIASGEPVALRELGGKANSMSLRIVSCTDGNWGRAVARLGRLMGIPTRIYVPRTMDEATRRKVSSEGADVTTVDGDYDDAVAAAEQTGRQDGWLLVMDHSWPGYHEIPNWVVDGYSTCLAEVDAQVLEATGGRTATHAVCGVGVGSWAQSLVLHYKASTPSEGPRTRVIAVEADAAPCLNTSLKDGRIMTVETRHTIMDGLNCGTVSENAWPYLRDGADASVVVTDTEADGATRYLNDNGIHGGPCGAATLAALRKLVAEDREKGALKGDSVVVLFCSEANREYSLQTQSEPDRRRPSAK